jgi:hypothetical protein
MDTIVSFIILVFVVGTLVVLSSDNTGLRNKKQDK